MDLCLVNGTIITMDPDNPKVDAVVIRDEKIIGTGTSEEMKTLCANNAKIIDLKGKTVLPGFIDSHIHLLGRGILLKQIDLRETKSIKEIKELIRKEVEKKPSGDWIVGRGWNNNLFLTENRFPTRWDVDEVAPDNPVILIRVCGHVTVANSTALALANISKDTDSPSGGQIDKDPETKEPTGVLRETASNLARDLVSFSDEEYISALKAACDLAVSKGLTSIHCLPRVSTKGQSPEGKSFQTLLMRDELPLRAYLMIPEPSLYSLIELGLSTGFGNPWVKIGGIKILGDGSLGGRTAAMLEPYTDDPDERGILIYSEEELHNIVKKAHKANFQVGIHCIGDRAVTIALDAIEAALEEYPRTDHRHRIEHYSVLSEELIQRTRKLGVIAAVQPPFIASDGDWTPDRIGEERARYTYPFKTLFDKGIPMAAGSDCPVESLDPLLGIQAAVTRVTAKGGVFIPEERISIEQAIKMYTIDAAYASFEDSIKGSIEPGKLGDVVVLSDNLLEVPPNKISEIIVEMTIVGGKIVYSNI